MFCCFKTGLAVMKGKGFVFEGFGAGVGGFGKFA